MFYSTETGIHSRWGRKSLIVSRGREASHMRVTACIVWGFPNGHPSQLPCGIMIVRAVSLNPRSAFIIIGT